MNKKVLGFDEFHKINESEGNEAIVIGTGDWSEILVNPTPENVEEHCMFILPSTFNVTYNSNPDESEYPPYNDPPENNAEYIMLGIMGGDQSGVNVAPSHTIQKHGDPLVQSDRESGIIRNFTTLPSSEVKAELEKQIQTLNRDIVAINEMAEETLEYVDDIESVFTPEYIEFLKGVRDENKNVNGFSIKLNYKEI